MIVSSRQKLRPSHEWMVKAARAKVTRGRAVEPVPAFLRALEAHLTSHTYDAPGCRWPLRRLARRGDVRQIEYCSSNRLQGKDGQRAVFRLVSQLRVDQGERIHIAQTDCSPDHVRLK